MKFKELLREEDFIKHESRASENNYKKFKQTLESFRFQRDEAIKKVTEEWNKKIEQLKKEFSETITQK